MVCLDDSLCSFKAELALHLISQYLGVAFLAFSIAAGAAANVLMMTLRNCQRSTTTANCIVEISSFDFPFEDQNIVHIVQKST